MKKSKNLNNFSLADKYKKSNHLQKVWRNQRKFRGFDDTELYNLYYTMTMLLLPRLEEFRKTTISFPCNETEETYFQKIDFIIEKFKKRIDKNYIYLDVIERDIIHKEACDAARILGELWWDLWS